MTRASTYLKELVDSNGKDASSWVPPHIQWVFAPTPTMSPMEEPLDISTCIKEARTPAWVNVAPAKVKAPPLKRNIRIIGKHTPADPAGPPGKRRRPKGGGRESKVGEAEDDAGNENIVVAVPPADAPRPKVPSLAGSPAHMGEPSAPPGVPHQLMRASLPSLPDGVSLGCSKCRRASRGCKECRKKVGVFYVNEKWEYIPAKAKPSRPRRKPAAADPATSAPAGSSGEAGARDPDLSSPEPTG